jgi:outer membrane lipase/esterase
MQALADTYYAAIKTHALDKGAQRVVALNAPDITLTPRFQQVLGAVAASSGQPTANAVRDLIRQWAQAFNAQLATRVAGDARVAVVDFYGIFTAQVTNPSSFGLTNATQTACPQIGTGSDGLPSYTFATCTSAALDAGQTPGWWSRWLFSDSFHPTPYGHRLMADEIWKVLSAARFF